MINKNKDTTRGMIPPRFVNTMLFFMIDTSNNMHDTIE